MSSAVQDVVQAPGGARERADYGDGVRLEKRRGGPKTVYHGAGGKSGVYLKRKAYHAVTVY